MPDREQAGGGGTGGGGTGGRGPGKEGGSLEAALLRWSGEKAAVDAALARTRERWLRQQAGEEATLAGVLVDLAERRALATVVTRSGSHAGRVVGVGRDFCVIEAGGSIIASLDAVVSVTPGIGTPEITGAPRATAGDRGAPLAMDLTSVLALLAADRTPVRLLVSGGSTVAGTLDAVGDGVLRCTLEGPGRRATSVVLAAIESCALG